MFEIPTDKKLERAGQITGTVVSIGPLCWLNHEDTTPWCKVGDSVMYSRFAGKFVDDPITKEQYVILNDEDIIATVDRPTEG